MITSFLLKIPYVKQIGIGMLVMIGLYMWYIVHQNKALLVTNAQYKNELRGWELSYESLINEMQKSEELLRQRRRYLATLAGEKKTLEMIVTQTKEDNANVKKWFNISIPNDVLLLRKQLRVQRSQRAREP